MKTDKSLAHATNCKHSVCTAVFADISPGAATYKQPCRQIADHQCPVLRETESCSVNMHQISNCSVEFGHSRCHDGSKRSHDAETEVWDALLVWLQAE